MKDLVIVTPSYAPDAELCSDLADSVQEMTGSDVEHHIIVPRADRRYFRHLAGPRTYLRDVREFLPQEWMKVPRKSIWVNKKRPWPPVRGWIAQQVVKLACSASFSARGVLLIDSDMVLVRPVDLQTFMQSARLALYRRDGAVHRGLPRHRLWHESARMILGLEPPGPAPLPDYVCWPCMWEPHHVRAMLEYIEGRTGRAWETVVGSQIHFSEMMLYGIYLDEIVKDGQAVVTSTMHSIVHTEERLLNSTELQMLLANGSADAVAVMISAKSGIPLEERRQVLSAFRGTLKHREEGTASED